MKYLLWKYLRWRLRRLLSGTALLLTVLLVAGCGGGSGSSAGLETNADSGEVLIALTDAQGDFVTYTVDIASITLERADGKIVETLPNAARIDFAQYVELTELFTAAQVPNGRYVGGSITLDYSTADVQVEVDGMATPAVVKDENGDALMVYSLDLKLENDHPLVVAVGRPALLTIDFDLAASHEVDTSPAEPIVTAAPFLIADVEPVDEKDLRVRGALRAVNLDESTYAVRLRPWYRRLGDFGPALVHINDATEFEVDGESYVGQDGLVAMDGLETGSLTVALGTLDLAERQYTAHRVIAGDSVAGARHDAVFGNVIARRENLLTVRGATVVPRSGSVIFNDDVEIEIGENTLVKKAGEPGVQQRIAAVSVGQRVAVFGELTSNPAFPGLTMDATDGRVRMRYTRLFGAANTVIPGQLNMELHAIDRRRVSLFDFTGTGLDESLDADPRDYEIATGNLNTGFVIPGTPVQVRGFANTFGEAPPDFEGRTVIDIALARAHLGVGWGVAGTTAPFLVADPNGIVIDLENPDLGSRHHIRLGDVVIDLKDLHASPTIVGKRDGRRRFAIKQGHRVQVFRDFSRFMNTLNLLLDGSTHMRSMHAKGAYHTVENTLTASVIGVYLKSAVED